MLRETTKATGLCLAAESACVLGGFPVGEGQVEMIAAATCDSDDADIYAFVSRRLGMVSVHGRTVYINYLYEAYYENFKPKKLLLITQCFLILTFLHFLLLTGTWVEVDCVVP